MPTVYYDPGLWSALADRVAEEIAVARDALCDGHWKTLEEARAQIGYIKGLTWVLETAADMQTAPEPD